ncbi:MAG: hypothetical protein IT337_01625 [Thermomicrobiales bacterium]|nr:hypothetical protein [Thermomicrobiales bacterium]
MDQALHDRVARHIADKRFPFPNQQNWPADFQTVVNAGQQNRAIELSDGAAYPDIVIVDGGDTVREMGEIELAVDDSLAAKWAAYSAALPINPDTNVRQFFVYGPSGQEETARQLLDQNGISYAGVRQFLVADDGAIRIIPYVTPGAAQDHRE